VPVGGTPIPLADNVTDPGAVPPTAAVRLATGADLPAVASTLALAFHADPVFGWIWPNPELRRRRLPRFFAELGRRQYLPQGAVYLAPGGAAMWATPGRHAITLWKQVQLAPSLAGVLGTGALRALRALALVEPHHPPAPHYYLFAIGAEPHCRGVGLGSALLAPILARCDAEGLPAHLENSNPSNTPFYRRHGFAPGRELTMPGGPPVLIMTRPAKR
jgi:GNAT superfamily N-acetyltransferase